MKKCASIFFFILFASCALAGTTTLTTWYPPPTAAYNTVSLSTNNVAAATTPGIYCTGSNNGAIFLDSATGILNDCTGMGTAAPYCTVANYGVLMADNTGTLHVCTNSGQDTLYPQQCYNSICSYDTAKGALNCTPAPLCQPGFTKVLVGVLGHDHYQTSATTYVNSYACCR